MKAIQGCRFKIQDEKAIQDYRFKIQDWGMLMVLKSDSRLKIRDLILKSL